MTLRSETIPIAIIAFQTGVNANGGISSLGQIIDNLEGFRPIIVTQLETAVTRDWRAKGHQVEVWPVHSPFALPGRSRAPKWKRTLSIAAANLRMAALIKKSKVRLVHCNDLLALMIAGPVAKLLGVPVVLNIRDTLGVRGVKWKMARVMADQVVVLSQEMAAAFERDLNLPSYVPAGFRTPIQVVYSVVDTARLRPLEPSARQRARERLGIEEDEFAVGIVGAILEKKQQLEFLRYLSAHAEGWPRKAVLYLVGDYHPEADEYAKQCAQVAEATTLRGKVRFVGYQRAMEAWYPCLDCTVIASKEEGLARAMVESVACGTPVVSFDVCSAREIVEQYGLGFVVPQGDYQGLLRCVRELVAAHGQGTASNGPEVAKSLFDGAVNSRMYATLYRSMMDSRASAA